MAESIVPKIEYEGRELFEAYAKMKGVPIDKVIRNAMRDVVGFIVKNMPVHPKKSKPIAFWGARGGQRIILPLSVLRDDNERMRVLGQKIATQGKNKGKVIRNRKKKNLAIPIRSGWNKATLFIAGQDIGLAKIGANKLTEKAKGYSRVTSSGLGTSNPIYEFIDKVGFDAPCKKGTENALIAGGIQKANDTIKRDFERELTKRWK